MTDLEKLLQENKNLKKQLGYAKKWMKRAVQAQYRAVSNHDFGCNLHTEQKRDELEEEITSRITDYFGELALINLPADFTDNIIKAEISYRIFREDPDGDGLSVIVSYHKAIDSLIESLITKGFRKFAHKDKDLLLRHNDQLEKFLNSVVNKGYILGIGRFYHVIELISSGKQLFEFEECFKLYLDKYKDIGEVLLDKEFLNLFKQLIDTQVLGKKRHVGNISFVETRKARELLVGNLVDKNSLIHKIVSANELTY